MSSVNEVHLTTKFICATTFIAIIVIPVAVIVTKGKAMPIICERVISESITEYGHLRYGRFTREEADCLIDYMMQEE